MKYPHFVKGVVHVTNELFHQEFSDQRIVMATDTSNAEQIYEDYWKSISNSKGGYPQYIVTLVEASETLGVD